MLTTLILVRYRTAYIPFALLSMALFRITLRFHRNLIFWKLMGCGKNGTFDLVPDFSQWALFCVWQNQAAFDDFAEKSVENRWWSYFCKSKTTYICHAYESHGRWDGKDVFHAKTHLPPQNRKIAVLTRATIRFSKLLDFWKNVPVVAQSLHSAAGFITSVGIGEIPFIKQATFSVWENATAIKDFAYKQKEHAEVIKKTRKNDWYSEELFARFEVLEIREE